MRTRATAKINSDPDETHQGRELRSRQKINYNFDPLPPSSSQPEDTQTSVGTDWPVKGILDQKTEAGQELYLIDWASQNPDTGAAWTPTWQKSAQISPDLLQDWARRQASQPGARLKALSTDRRSQSTGEQSYATSVALSQLVNSSSHHPHSAVSSAVAASDSVTESQSAEADPQSTSGGELPRPNQHRQQFKTPFVPNSNTTIRGRQGLFVPDSEEAPSTVDADKDQPISTESPLFARAGRTRPIRRQIVTSSATPQQDSGDNIAGISASSKTCGDSQDSLHIIPDSLEIANMPSTRSSGQGNSSRSTSKSRGGAAVPQSTAMRRTRSKANEPEEPAATSRGRTSTTDQTQSDVPQIAISEDPAPALSPGESETGVSHIPARVEKPAKLAPQDAQGNTRLPAPSDARAITATPEPLTTNEMLIDAADAASTASWDAASLLSTMEFRVLLPMTGQASDHYRRTITFNKDLVKKFADEHHNQGSETFQQAEQLVNTLLKTTTHIDLVNPTLSQEDSLGPYLQSEWDINVSTKFRFLIEVLEFLHGQPFTIALLSPPGRLPGMLKRVLESRDIDYRVANVSDSDIVEPSQKPKSSLKVVLLPTDYEGEIPQLPRLRLILSFDPNLDVNLPLVAGLRSQPANSTTSVVPLISLAVRNSVDHVIRFISPEMSLYQRILLILYSATELRKLAGRPRRETHVEIKDSAENVGRFILMQGDAEAWPLPIVEETDNAEVWAYIESRRPILRIPNTSQELATAGKRRLSYLEDDATTAAKRLRVDVVDAQDAAQASESAQALQAANDLVATLETKLRTEQNDKSALTDKVKEMEGLLAQKQHIIREKNSAYTVLSADLEGLQFRYEDLRLELATSKKRNEELDIQIEVMRKQRERREETVTLLKQENTSVKEDYAKAMALAETSQVPDVAEIARLIGQVKALEEEAAKYKKKNAETETTFNVLRDTYASAGLRITELTQENAALQARIQMLEKDSSGEAGRAREVNRDASVQRMSSEIKRLEACVEQRDGILKKKEDELKSRRMAMGTRAGSVPRSPRVGPSSRAASPIPDRRIGLLKGDRNHTPRRTPKGSAKLIEDASDPQPYIPTSDPAPHLTTSSGRPHSNSNGSQTRDEVMLDDKTQSADPMQIDTPASQQAATQAPSTAASLKAEAKANSTPSKPQKAAQLNVHRPFPCTFAQYGCAGAFSSKNEWKRHISTKHIQLGFWRCDMCPPSPGIDAPVYNDFNRKDLFTQHLRRMHGGLPATNGPGAMVRDGQPVVASDSTTTPATAAGSNLVLTEEQIAEIQKRCYRQTRLPPQQSACIFCVRPFEGPGSWEERLEHVGGHLERFRKNAQFVPQVDEWRPDPLLKDYLLLEGIVEVDERGGGGYRIGDNKSRREGPMLLPVNGTPAMHRGLSASLSMESPANGDQSPFMSQTGVAVMQEMVEPSFNSRQRRRGRPSRREPHVIDARPVAIESPLNQQSAVIEKPLTPGHSEHREIRPKPNINANIDPAFYTSSPSQSQGPFQHSPYPDMPNSQASTGPAPYSYERAILPTSQESPILQASAGSQSLQLGQSMVPPASSPRLGLGIGQLLPQANIHPSLQPLQPGPAAVAPMQSPRTPMHQSQAQDGAMADQTPPSAQSEGSGDDPNRGGRSFRDVIM